MTSNILCIATFAFVALSGLTTNADEVVNSCYSGPVVKHFELKWLCGKYVRTQILSGAHNHTQCILCSIDCEDDRTARVTQYIVRDGVKSEPEFSTLTVNGKGKLIRIYDNEPSIVQNVFIVSYGQHLDGSVKVGCLQCSDIDDSLFRIYFFCDYSAILVDELLKVKEYFTNVPFTCLPDTCLPKDYFP